jgi:hypothetical protein
LLDLEAFSAGQLVSDASGASGANGPQPEQA